MPVPSFHDVAGLDEQPLAEPLELSDGRRCRLDIPQPGLLEDDCAALLPLPTGTTPGPRSPAARSPWDWVPSASRRSTPRPTRSWRPAPRERGDALMDSADPTLQLRLLCMRPGGRGCSGRQGSPCASRPRGSTGRTCGSPRAGAATTCTFLSDIAMNIASMDY
ncbi:hypothetical protein DXB86_07705 [Collinsella sp. OM06-18AC]|nr:hypothetical protein DXB86_07705 [Collinsella sp. OM06-18AC]